MPHITPTPTSDFIWIALWSVPPLIGLITYFILKVTKKYEYSLKRIYYPLIAFAIPCLFVSVFACSSMYYNYTHSSSYIKDLKDIKIEYDTDNQVRNIVVMDYTGKEIYNYTGKFSFDRSGHGLNLVDNVTGKKISIYIGDNDSVVVTDK